MSILTHQANSIINAYYCTSDGTIYIFASDYKLIYLLTVAYGKESQDLSLVKTHILTTYKLLVISLKVAHHYSGQPQWISTGRLLSSYFPAHLTQLVCDYFRSHTESAAKEHLLHHPPYPSATAYSTYSCICSHIFS